MKCNSKSAKELLALAALLALGLQNTPADAQQNNRKGGDALKAMDRSNIMLVRAGKGSVCGKCGANSCGAAYMARVRHGHHAAQMKRLHKQNHGGQHKK